MESIKNNQTVPIAENQPEYHYFGSEEINGNLIPSVTVGFTLNEDEIKKLSETKEIYFTQLGMGGLKPFRIDFDKPY